RLAEARAPRREHELTAQREALARTFELEPQQPVMRGHGSDLDFVLDRQIEDTAIPDEVVHPHGPRDAIKLLPARDAILGDEPLAEGEGGEAGGRTYELLR